MREMLDELKKKIVAELELTDIRPEDIKDDEAFFQGGLGLASIDLLFLCAVLDFEYGVLIDNKELGEKVFRNLTTLAEYITQHRTK
ncbi:MAG: acyl carrier protein [Deltaproteobacteria bacterium]|nr:acyl carrier protein [Deltaproteobacteria bacterium]